VTANSTCAEGDVHSFSMVGGKENLR
jgi:hypothetical protein